MSLFEFLSGCVGGIVGTTVCYPADTIKTNLQIDPKYKFSSDIKTNGIRSLYSGVTCPMLCTMFEKATLFAANDWLRKNTSMNEYKRGFVAGFTTTLIVTPFELIKIRAQKDRISSWKAFRKIWRRNGIIGFGRGWTATWFREVPGYTIYIPVYETMRQNRPNIIPTHIWWLITGAMCGTTAWMAIYPSDPIKTTMQEQNVGMISALRILGIRGLYRGFTWGISRAAIFHACVIYAYEFSNINLRAN